MFCWSPLFLPTCFISGEINYQKNTAPTFCLRWCRWPSGLGLFAFTQSLEIAARAPAINTRVVLLTLSFLCCLVAGGFFFLGRGWMRAAAFPLAYLIFMVPMPDAMADALEMASTYATAEVANLLFQLSGIPFLRGPYFPTTEHHDRNCTGMQRYSIELGAFLTSILAANLFLKTPWRRFALIAFVIPLGILRNAFRVLVIGLLCVNIGPQMIHSLIHRRGGPFFFALSLIPLASGVMVAAQGRCAKPEHENRVDLDKALPVALARGVFFLRKFLRTSPSVFSGETLERTSTPWWFDSQPLAYGFFRIAQVRGLRPPFPRTLREATLHWFTGRSRAKVAGH